ncbi:MAG: type II secretion system F family protein [Acidimicrobiia bacterium]
MVLLAGLCAALFVYFVIGFATGWIPEQMRFANSRGRTRAQKVSRQAWLTQAGASATPTQFWLTSAGLGVVTFVLLFAVTGVATFAVVPAFGAGALPRMYYARRRRTTAEARVRAWPDALRTLTANIAASQSLHQALKGLATTGPVPLRPTFTRYNQLCVALDQKSALELIKEELSDPVSDRVIEVLIVATDAGPAIVLDVLRELATATTKDLQLNDHIETAQTEQKLNAGAVFVLPFLLLGMMIAQGGAAREFYLSSTGFIVIAIGSLMLVGGMFIVRKLGKLPGERRVFGRNLEEVPA